MRSLGINFTFDKTPQQWGHYFSGEDLCFTELSLEWADSTKENSQRGYNYGKVTLNDVILFWGFLDCYRLIKSESNTQIDCFSKQTQNFGEEIVRYENKVLKIIFQQLNHIKANEMIKFIKVMVTNSRRKWWICPRDSFFRMWWNAEDQNSKNSVLFLLDL